MSANPSIFQILNSTGAVTALLGSNPLRFYPYSQAPKISPKPYAVYGVFSGIPENYLGQVPDIDNKGTQIDIYADSSQSAEDVFIAIRDALEPHAHMISFATSREGETDSYHIRMEFDIWEPR